MKPCDGSCLSGCDVYVRVRPYSVADFSRGDLVRLLNDNRSEIGNPARIAISADGDAFGLE